jgi:hypothetical protein
MPGTFEPNLLYSQCRTILSQDLFGPWSGVIFRSVSPRYARVADVVSGYGSYRAGGRWNAPGIYAIYGGIEPGLAADESFNFLLQHFGWQNCDALAWNHTFSQRSLRFKHTATAIFLENFDQNRNYPKAVG